jgi:hypothetical protein
MPFGSLLPDSNVGFDLQDLSKFTGVLFGGMCEAAPYVAVEILQMLCDRLRIGS